MLTQYRLKELLSYDENTGDFTWIKKGHGIKIGRIAGTTTKHTYRQIMIDNKTYLSHRLVWLYVYGYFPDKLIDHINGNGLDNRINNLREADHSQNLHNSRLCKRNTSGFKGVFWHCSNKKWYAQININGKNKHLGFFDSKYLANEAVSVARYKYHGEFANNG